ncbi:putative enoyl-CoA hydratase [Caenibius tardaugens NBRC 16725]|uniref:Putative enoyl-CoA hydratase n=1 Tax=Caenibius tardaugens NBRC 16725 TaxID=1219035 RepID=U2ZZG0_9SPHN|nr:MaoC family dehydratase [Caenibius tardaugens]AZI36899.1 MaoC family dehydratase [Caenibius tardaugens NBRC 16725]TXG93588.1 MAG: MaoC family dehydratase [Rhodocyclaceae bacterium]GAD47898.1 putative enoyl-CoA hydratase [Caenibius tardaugens NBRC 16725]
MAVIFNNPRDLLGKEGTTLEPSAWLTVEQDRIDAFADCTGDHQWIHVDPVKAKDGPFGATIAHGYLTLSLVNMFMPQMIDVRGFTAGVNVGMDKTRFLNPVVVGSRVRGTGEIVSVEEVKGGAIQAVIRVTVEIEGKDRPACVVDTINRYFPE